MRARPARFTAAVKRPKDQALIFPQGTEISLTGKDIVLKCNLAVSVPGLAHHETETKHPPVFKQQQEMQY